MKLIESFRTLRPSGSGRRHCFYESGVKEGGRRNAPRLTHVFLQLIMNTIQEKQDIDVMIRGGEQGVGTQLPHTKGRDWNAHTLDCI